MGLLEKFKVYIHISKATYGKSLNLAAIFWSLFGVLSKIWWMAEERSEESLL